MGAHQEERQVSEKAIVEKETQEAGAECNHQPGMAGQAQDVAQIVCRWLFVLAFGLRHAKQRD